MKPESGPMEGDYPWREFLRYCHELNFGVFQINQDKPIIEQILHLRTSRGQNETTSAHRTPHTAAVQLPAAATGPLSAVS